MDVLTPDTSFDVLAPLLGIDVVEKKVVLVYHGYFFILEETMRRCKESIDFVGFSYRVKFFDLSGKFYGTCEYIEG